MTDINHGVTIEGAGTSTLTFRGVPGLPSLGTRATLDITVADEGNTMHHRSLAWLTIPEHEARAFLVAMEKHEGARVMSRGDTVEYEPTEQGHVFTLRRHTARALRRFVVSWSMGVDHMARGLLSKMAGSSPPKPQPAPPKRDILALDLSAPPIPEPFAGTQAPIVGQPSYSPAPGRLP